jgi:hypothetical protein
MKHEARVNQAVDAMGLLQGARKHAAVLSSNPHRNRESEGRGNEVRRLCQGAFLGPSQLGFLLGGLSPVDGHRYTGCLGAPTRLAATAVLTFPVPGREALMQAGRWQGCYVAAGPGWLAAGSPPSMAQKSTMSPAAFM